VCVCVVTNMACATPENYFESVWWRG